MSLTVKRKKHKIDKPRSHKKIKKILQKKKREKVFKEAHPIPKPKDDLPLSPTECVLKLTGMPYATTEDDIRDWFQKDGINVEEIHICGKVRKCGMAYVTMKKKSVMRLGLAKHKQHMGERYVNVELKRKTEMAEVLKLAEMMDNAVFLRGLPFEVYRLDILRFFEGMQIAPRGIHIKNKGFGIVEFINHETAEAALKKNDEYIRERYIKVFPCRMKDLVLMRDQIFAEKNKPLEGEKTRKTSESLPEEGKEVAAEINGEENKDVEMDVEEKENAEEGVEEDESAEKASDSDEKLEESDNEEEKAPVKEKPKNVVEVVQDKFSPRRLRSRTGTPVKKKTPVKRLARGSARKAKK